MEIFYAHEVTDTLCILDAEESAHAVKVLRHRAGDEICVIDGEGTMFRCSLVDDSPKGASAMIQETFPGWGSHPYNLTLAVCPTKNNDRFEWFAEKATEVGVDRIVPVIGDRSERKVFKTERLRKIVLSATKQSLKSKLPVSDEPVSVKQFIASAPEDALKLIAYCFEAEKEKVTIKSALEGCDGREIIIMIGPEGDFSPEEAALAIDNGFIPVSLGDSRLRTETAGVTAAEAVYFRFM